MVAFKNLLFFITSASALTIGKRDAATILSDISTIDTNVNALTTAANNYNGGILAALPITSAESTLENSIKQGTTDAQATSQLSSADAQSIIAAINTLIPDIATSLTAVENKKADFASDGLTSIVLGDLNSLKNDTDAFADALIAIASADTETEAQSQKATIDSDFQAAIDDFAS
ncbi:hydrophobic surface binding protein-like protein A [Acephala macrosclerotiorum]|nr:hydrophobic surface binding protein-like protein A [Acephala macrosclerotiorum]